MNVETYTEVYEMLKLMGEDYIKKLPEELYEYLEQNADPSYIHGVSFNIDDIDLSDQAADMITYLNYEYFANEKTKKILEEISNSNMEKLKEKYNTENMFQRREIKKDTIVAENLELEPVKESFFTKIINKIKSLFKTS